MAPKHSKKKSWKETQKDKDEQSDGGFVPAVSDEETQVDGSETEQTQEEVAEDEPKLVDSDDEEVSEKKKRKRHKSKRKTKNDEGDDQPNTLMKFEGHSESATFADFNLDERLLKAIGELGWEKPTQIQQSMIPLALEDKSITARARTGSGKTAAFMLPVLQKILHLTSASASSSLVGPHAVFIAPTRELAVQMYKVLIQLTASFPFLQTINFADIDPSKQDDWLQEQLDMVVSTPSRLVSACKKKPALCSHLRHVVLDEADLLISYGYEDDMRNLKEFMPQSYQTIFTSATLTEDIDLLKKLFLNGPLVTLKLKEGQLAGGDQLAQYLISCRTDEERFAILLAMIKLKLLVGKSIIFVSEPDRCYQLGLFLQAFQIRSCILNSQMPMNSRCHVVDEFNEGRYNYVIASDVSDVIADGASEDPHQQPMDKKKPIKKRKAIDRESGVARGIDFHHVSNVVNFDLPTTFDCYVHRVGRTARGWNKGTALSFATPEEESLVDSIRADVSEMGCTIVPYEIRIKELESFVLRAREALSACTRSVIREARLAEIKGEVLRSKRLEGYFGKNPRERTTLEHDKKMHTLSLHSPAISDVPDYIVPPSLRGMNFAPEKRKGKKKRSQKRNQKRVTPGQAKHRKIMEDPLQSFNA